MLSRTGERVLALDSDPMPGLAFSLGVARRDAGLPDDAVQEYHDDTGRRRYRLNDGSSGTQAVERYGVPGPDGVVLLQLGKAQGQRWDNTRQHFGFQQILDDLPGKGWSVVGDLPGGTRQPFMSWGRFAETILVIVEPTPSSLMTGRRLARLAQTKQAPRVVAVVNKVREPADVQRVSDLTGLPVIGAVPFDPEVTSADRLGVAIVDHDPEGLTVAAVRLLVDVLRTDLEPA